MANRNLTTPSNQGRTPTQWRENDFSPSSFQRAMDRLFDDFFRAPAYGSLGDFGSLATSWPSIDVKDRDGTPYTLEFKYVAPMTRDLVDKILDGRLGWKHDNTLMP